VTACAGSYIAGYTGRRASVLQLVHPMLRSTLSPLDAAALHVITGGRDGKSHGNIDWAAQDRWQAAHDATVCPPDMSYRLCAFHKRATASATVDGRPWSAAQSRSQYMTNANKLQ
jgi:hypothetical protein